MFTFLLVARTVNCEQWVCWTRRRIFGVCVQLQLLTKESAWSLLFIDVLMYSSDKKAKVELIDLSFLYNSHFYLCKKTEYIYMYMYQVYDVHFQFYFFIVSNMMDVKKKSLLTGRRDKRRINTNTSSGNWADSVVCVCVTIFCLDC